MRVLHVYDGHERVYPGEGSVPSIVYELSRTLVKEGIEVTILERRWEGTKYREEIDGINFERFDLKISSNKSNEEIVAREIKKFTGLFKFIIDRAVFALKANKFLNKNKFDIIHVHLPFASNILVNINKNLRRKTVYTAHVGEEGKRFGLN
ncbi:MAG: glycosyltransferase family 4 protein, partial [Leptospiraceae bacterium]|nr:glycosyltransferase family 4 protein [Leptospiraceae bacterium]